MRKIQQCVKIWHFSPEIIASRRRVQDGSKGCVCSHRAGSILTPVLV